MRHPVETAVAVAAALVAVAFALSTFERWLAAGKRHEAAWSAALAMFALAAGALAAGAQAQWSGPVFRVFYLFGAIVNVPVLALGTVYLLADRRVGDRAAALTALFAAFAAGVVMTAPFTHPLPPDQLAQGSRVFATLPRVLAGVASAGGAVVIFAGAAWSAWRLRRSAAGTRLAWSNGLIALGTLILGASGTLNSVFGAMTAFAVTLLVGIVVIFGGFIVATVDRSATPRTTPEIPPAEPWYPLVRAAVAGDGSGADRPRPAAQLAAQPVRQ